MVKRAAMMVKRKGGANHIEDKIIECDQVSTALGSREAKPQTGSKHTESRKDREEREDVRGAGQCSPFEKTGV